MGWTRFLNMVKAELNPAKPPTPAPKPTPTKITYQVIPKKSIELIRNANLWNFNFTDWNKAKAVKTHSKGEVIENIVAIATNPVGAKYYVTEYSYSTKATNGFNINDAKDYVKPKPTPKPEPKPETPKPEEPKEPEQPTIPVEPDLVKENNTLLKLIWEAIKSLLSIFNLKKGE